MEYYTGQICIFGFNFAPRDWAACNGQWVPINQYPALYSIIGGYYGSTNTEFQLPDFRGRVPVHPGGGILLGYPGGVEQITLQTSEIPSHTHNVFVAGGNMSSDPENQGLGTSTEKTLYCADGKDFSSLHSNTVAHTGGGQPHENCQPSQALNFCICLDGLFPSRN